MPHSACLQTLAADQLIGQGPIIYISYIRRLRPFHQNCDVDGQLLAQFLRAVIMDETVFRGIGINLHTVDQHRAKPQKSCLACQKEQPH